MLELVSDGFIMQNHHLKNTVYLPSEALRWALWAVLGHSALRKYCSPGLRLLKGIVCVWNRKKCVSLEVLIDRVNRKQSAPTWLWEQFKSHGWHLNDYYHEKNIKGNMNGMAACEMRTARRGAACCMLSYRSALALCLNIPVVSVISMCRAHVISCRSLHADFRKPL